jgi:predicted AAA+ superfamily ATPase
MSYASITSVGRLLEDRISEPAPGLIQVLAGPRQVGKTTLLLKLQKKLGAQSIYAACDAPESALPGWWDNLWQNAERLAEKGKACLLIDEIHYLSEWSSLLKGRFDRILRERIPIHVVVSGSSALHLGQGTRESMSGRFERHSLRHWIPSDMIEYFKFSADEAAEWFLNRGSFPGAVRFSGDFKRYKSYIRDSILEPVIGHDILMSRPVRNPALLRQIFAVCAGHPAEIVSLQKLSGEITSKGTQATVADYLALLEEAGLVAPVRKYSRAKVRERSSPPKLVILNQAFLSAFDSSAPPIAGKEPDRFGRWLENACLSFAWNSGQEVHYWRKEPLEVDFITEGTWGRWAIEVKSGGYSLSDLTGLLEFCKNEKKFRPLIICAKGKEKIGIQAGIKCISWQKFLAHGPIAEE